VNELKQTEDGRPLHPQLSNRRVSMIIYARCDSRNLLSIDGMQSSGTQGEAITFELGRNIAMLSSSWFGVVIRNGGKASDTETVVKGRCELHSSGVAEQGRPDIRTYSMLVHHQAQLWSDRGARRSWLGTMSMPRPRFTLRRALVASTRLAL